MTKKSTAKKSVNKAAASSSKKPMIDEPILKTLQTSKCRTISDKSELTYNIAIDDKGSFQVRINNNTGGGYWSKEYVSFDAIVKTLNAVPDDSAITSIHLVKLYKGKSSNTPGFLLAVLLKEGVLTGFQGKKRQYALDDTGLQKFLVKIEKLKSSNG